MRRTVGCLLIACLCLPLAAAAQSATPEGRGFLSVYAGVQSSDGASSRSGTFSVYDETGSFSATQSFDGGGVLSVGGGVRVWRNLAVGATYTRVSDEQVATVSVTAPHPLLFNTPRTATAEQAGLRHDENAFHLQLLFVVPIGERFELAAGGGPSFISVTHDVITGASFSESGAPYSTIAVANVGVTATDKTATGFNLGAEAAYYVTRNIGVGGFVRWTGATTDLEVAGGDPVEVDLGGPQVGGGVRIRF